VNDFGASGQKITNDQALKLYGLFKQANVGDVNTDRPGIFSQKDRAKWDAWEKEKGKSAEQAKSEYVSYARSILPDEWSSRIA
jgi:diazepam-binding inhibitor (GABA receptor modulating acyl-CoA-binding protein)